MSQLELVWVGELESRFFLFVNGGDVSWMGDEWVGVRVLER